MLTELSATNFKSWRSINRMRLAQITGLFGTNSSGKTSILQLLLMLRQTVESSDRTAVLEFGGERNLTQLGSFRDVIFAHKLDEPLGIRLCWRLPSEMKIVDPSEAGKELFSGQDVCFATEVCSNSDKLYVRELSYDLAGNRFVMNRKATTGAKYELHANADGFAFLCPEQFNGGE